MGFPSQARVVIMGASCLYHLAKAGRTDALLLAKNELAGGGTWHAAWGGCLSRMGAVGC